MRAPSIDAGKIPVDPGKIASALDRIRREAAELDAVSPSERTGSDTPRVRATLSNVILLTSAGEDSLSVEELEEIITDLCITHPSRFFVVQCLDEKKDGSEDLKTSVSSRCVRADSGVHVCSEEIYISATRQGLSLVPNLLLSLLLPDLKTIMFVLSDPGSKCRCVASGPLAGGGVAQFVAEVSRVCDAVVVDSSSYFGCADSLRVLSGDALSAPELDGGVLLYDLSWRRLRRMREIITEQFDIEQLLLPTVHLKEIRISAAVARECCCSISESLLLAAWMLSSLSWEVETALVSDDDGARGRVFCRNVSGSSDKNIAGDKVQLSFYDYKGMGCGELRSGQIAEVDFFFEQGELMLHLALKQVPASPFVEASLCRGDSKGGSAVCDFISRRVPYAELKVSELMTWQLRSMERDPLYIAAFPLMKRLSVVLESAGNY